MEASDALQRCTNMFEQSWKLRTEKQALEQSIARQRAAISDDERKLREVQAKIAELEKRPNPPSPPGSVALSTKALRANATGRPQSTTPARTSAPKNTKVPPTNRPGLMAFAGQNKPWIPKSARAPSAVGGAARVPRGKYILCKELGCIAEFDNGYWHEIWCSICGANGPASRDGYFTGDIGLKRHINKVHEKAFKAAGDNVDDLISDHRLTKEEIISIRKREMTIRKVCDQPVHSSKSDTCRKARPQAANDMDDDEFELHVREAARLQQQRAISVSSNDISDEELAELAMGAFRDGHGTTEGQIATDGAESVDYEKDQDYDYGSSHEYMAPAASSSRKRKRVGSADASGEDGQVNETLVDRMKVRRAGSSRAHYADPDEDDENGDLLRGIEQAL